MAQIVQRLNATLAHRRAGWGLLVACAVAYAVAYFNHPLFPGSGGDALSRGWWTWADQQRYQAEAAAIAQGELTAERFHYPIGYPALGALFWRWMPANLFFVPDLLLVLAAAAALWRIGTRWLSRVEVLAVGVVFIATHRWLIAYTQVVPWNTLATQAALLAGVALALGRAGPRQLWLLVLLAALTYLTRPIDAVAFAPLLVSAVLRLEAWRTRVIHAIGGMAAVLATMAAAGWLHLQVFGQWRSPYEIVSAQTIGFFSYPISYKVFWLFVDGRALFAETEPALLFRYPWLVLAVPGLVFWLRRDGWPAAAGASALGANWLLYVNYNDLLPSDIYRFTLIHYLAWGFPLLFVLAAAAGRYGWRDHWVRGGFAGAVLVFAAGAGLRLEAQPVEIAPATAGGWVLPAERPLIVRVPQLPMARAADLRLDDRGLVEYSEFVGPYVDSDLQLMLGLRTQGRRLTIAGEPLPAGTSPEVSRWVWRWRTPLERLRQVSL